MASLHPANDELHFGDYCRLPGSYEKLIVVDENERGVIVATKFGESFFPRSELQRWDQEGR